MVVRRMFTECARLVAAAARKCIHKTQLQRAGDRESVYKNRRSTVDRNGHLVFVNIRRLEGAYEDGSFVAR